ncbi:MAG: hypothetical protein ACFCUE_01385 [Candidatus Bathyarchaeia archaeon]
MELNVSALETTLNEIKTAYPGVSSLMVLDGSNQVIARDRSTNDELVHHVSSSFEKITKKSAITGRIDNLTFKGTYQNIFFSRHQDIYLATVASNQISQKEVTRLTNILFPTTYKVIQEVVSFKQEKKTPQSIEEAKPKTIEPPSTPPQTQQPTTYNPKIPTPEPAPISKPAPIEILEAKFKVENISGFSVVSSSLDSVFLDRALIGEWRERYGVNSVDEVLVTAVESKKTSRCAFQPIKNSKLEGVGVVQVSHKVQASLGVKKGSLVIVKPVLKESLK